jgi:tetratricopeptide (TPR) repeat protein
VDIRVKLGDALRDAGEHDEALSQFELAIEQNGNFIPARIHYGIALYSAGRRDEAVAVWKDVLERSPGNKSALMYLNLVKQPGAGKADEQIG